MRRRKFLKTSFVGGAALGAGSLALQGCYRKTPRQLTILHTNDVHSHIDPFPPTDARFPNLGGVARRASLIAQIRSENPNTLLLDAGDIFQGTPYFNFYGGELEFRLMSKMGYQAATLGNHDFDNGLDGLLAQLPHARFPFLSANYDFSNTVLDGYIKPYEVFVADGIRVGIFGLGIELKGLVPGELYGETAYLDPVETAQEFSGILRGQEACDLVVCLSHLGYRYREANRVSDQSLAAATEGIDLILGGHTHTFMEKAEITTNRAGEPVLIHQVGCYGVNLGRVDFYFHPDGSRGADSRSIRV
ncbi:bifunctional metallophosphatase/5'-nucleotidase [Robiginitalea marina]|uniref:Metallophosphatase n=1 Tax=Robiginitalea marina TaxID=2954105 RepID=A0ABT1AVY8_9FLAO|nr:metallophosphatase [Robiginitalea marina]MCO5723740.1 metallophosphatase [Robiginitalea marina]